MLFFNEEPKVGLQTEVVFNNDYLFYDDEMEFIISNTTGTYAMVTFYNDIFEYDETPNIIIQKSTNDNFIDTYSLNSNIKLNEENLSDIHNYSTMKEKNR